MISSLLPASATRSDVHEPEEQSDRSSARACARAEEEDVEMQPLDHRGTDEDRPRLHKNCCGRTATTSPSARLDDQPHTPTGAADAGAMAVAGPSAGRLAAVDEAATLAHGAPHARRAVHLQAVYASPQRPAPAAA